MDRPGEWRAALTAALAQVQEQAVRYLPNLIGAFLLLLAGWIVARILRALSVRAAGALDRALARRPSRAGVERPRLPSSSPAILGSIVFWMVMLFFVATAAHVLGLDAFAGWLAGVARHLPTLAVGALIVAAGVLLSRLARDVVVAAAGRAGARQRELVGHAVQGIILVTAILVGADQIGIKVTFLVILAAATAGTVAGAVALALSLGARTYVANLIGGHHLRQTFSVGQSVKIAGFEGRILDLTPTTVVLDAAEGRVTLPAKIFSEEPIILVAPEDGRGEG